MAAARALWERRQFKQALAKYSAAVRASPRDASLLIEASRSFAARYRWDRATAYLERALAAQARNHEVQHCCGQLLYSMGHVEHAEKSFRRAVALSAAAPHSELELARLCERGHRLDEAAEFVDRVLKAEPRSLSARCLKGRIQRRRREHDAAETTLRTLVAGARSHPDQVAEALGELTLLYDDMQRYEEAWRAAQECKRIQLPRSQAEQRTAQFVEQRFCDLVESLTAEHFTRWLDRDRPSEDTRLALLTGFPRSGTTLLEQVLDAHPGVVISQERDVFSNDVFPRLGANHPPDAPVEAVLDALPDATLKRERDTYIKLIEAMLGEPIGDRLHIDKNPAMTPMIPAMLRVLGGLDLIVALRDPRDVVLSCYLRYLPLNPVSVCFLSLERTVERYALDIGAWLRMREMIPVRWVEVRYEDAVDNMAAEARRVTTAMGLPWDSAMLAYRDRMVEKHVVSPSYDAVARPVYRTSIGRWKNYQRQLEPVLDRLEPLLDQLGYARG